MNHIVKRIETRVLAPPGGYSSFSLGGGSGGADVYRKHNYKNQKLTNIREKYTEPTQACPKETQAEIQARATRALLAAYEQQGQGDIQDSLDSLVQPVKNSQNRNFMGETTAREGIGIPGLEKHYNDSTPQRQLRHNRQKPFYSLQAPPEPANVPVRSHRRAHQDEAKATTRIQHSQYADALQQQIQQKQQLDSRDPYADRRSLRPRARSVIDSDQDQDQDQGLNSPYVYSSPLRGVGEGTKRDTTSQATYAQQLKDQISAKKSLQDQNQDPYRQKIGRRNRPHSSEEVIDSSLSSLSRMGGAEKARKANQHSDARRYAEQLQSQIAMKQQIQYEQHSNSVGGGNVYNTDKLGNRVGNRLSIAVNTEN